MSNRDIQILKQIEGHSQKVNSQPVKKEYNIQRKSKVALLTLPVWAATFPPYNLARLNAMAKRAGYQSKIFDFNIAAKHAYDALGKPKGEYSNSLSSGWYNESSMEELLYPTVDRLVMEMLENYKPDIVGVSCYFYNRFATHRYTDMMKKHNPNIKIILGGPNTLTDSADSQNKFDIDYVSVGEGEETFLPILNEIDMGIVNDEVKIFESSRQRLSLDELPTPDYTDLDLNLYDMPNCMLTEFSRGCVAKCSFCAETHFWKYRQKESTTLVDELQELYENHGVQMFWFTDSLINGDLKKLKEFAIEVKERELPIWWFGYARHDKRMTDDYLQILKDGGLWGMNFGTETGSQSALNKMNKKVNVQTIHDNMDSFARVKLWAQSQILFGSPEEQISEAYKTYEMLWRSACRNLKSISIEPGYWVMSSTMVGNNPSQFYKKYSNLSYGGHWILDDFSQGGDTNKVRAKMANIFLKELRNTEGMMIENNSSMANPLDHYNFKFFKNLDNEFEQFDDFEDFHLIKEDLNPYAKTMVNEVWSLLRILWKMKGAFNIEITADPKIDAEFLGDSFGKNELSYNIKFDIDDEGNWAMKLNFDFEQVDEPFSFIDLDLNPSHITEAISIHSKGQQTEDEISEVKSRADRYNKEIDLSFQLDWEGAGQWHK